MSDINLPTTILSKEHENILDLLNIVDNEISHIENSEDNIDRNFFKKVIYFIKNYADSFHHIKEEDIFFIELNKDSVSMHCNPIPQMLHEHDLGRWFVKNIEDALEANNKGKLINSIKSYSELLREHIYKEDNILYPMADAALSSESQENILSSFEKAEEKNHEMKEKSLSLLVELKNKN
jgi:hemerythrin-like domain-containing protein